MKVEGFEAFLEVDYAYDYDMEVEGFYDCYSEKLSSLMNCYEAEHEDEILTGNLRIRSIYLKRDKRRYAEVKDMIFIGVTSLQGEVKGLKLM